MVGPACEGESPRRQIALAWQAHATRTSIGVENAHAVGGGPKLHVRHAHGVDPVHGIDMKIWTGLPVLCFNQLLWAVGQT